MYIWSNMWQCARMCRAPAILCAQILALSVPVASRAHRLQSRHRPSGANRPVPPSASSFSSPNMCDYHISLFTLFSPLIAAQCMLCASQVDGAPSIVQRRPHRRQALSAAQTTGSRGQPTFGSVQLHTVPSCAARVVTILVDLYPFERAQSCSCACARMRRVWTHL